MPGRNTHRSDVRNLEKAATVQIEYIIWPQWKYISLECACFQLLNCINEMAPSLTLWEDSTRFFEYPIFPATWRQPVIREKEPPLGYHIFAIDDRHEICFCGKGRALLGYLPVKHHLKPTYRVHIPSYLREQVQFNVLQWDFYFHLVTQVQCDKYFVITSIILNGIFTVM